MAFKISLGTISVTFNADTSKFKEGTRDVEKSVDHIDQRLSKSGGSFSKWSSNVSNAAKRAQSTFSKSTNALTSSINKTSASTKKLSNSFNKTSRDAVKTSNIISSAAKKFDATTEATVRKLKDTSSALGQAETKVKQTDQAFGRAAVGQRAYSSVTDKLSSSVLNAGKSTEQLNKGLKSTSFALDRVASSVGSALEVSRALKATSASAGDLSASVAAMAANVDKSSSVQQNAANAAAMLGGQFGNTASKADAAGKTISGAASKAGAAVDSAAGKVGGYNFKVGENKQKSDKAANAQRKFGDAAAKAGRQTDSAANGVTKLNAGLKSSASRLSSVAAAVSTALATNQIIKYSDAFISVQNEIKQTTDSTAELAARTDELFEIANRSRASVGATAELYRQLTKSTENLGLSSKELARLTETITKSFSLMGKPASESAGAIRQLGQALASGVLRGDEFNSIAEQAPEIMEALRKETGKTTGELRKFAETGGITAELLTTALSKYADTIDKKVAKATITFGQSLEIASNNLTKFIGENATINKATGMLGEAMIKLTENLDTVMKAVVVLGTVFATRYLVQLGKVAAANVLATKTTGLYTGALTTKTTVALRATTVTRGLGVAMRALGGPITIVVGILATLAAQSEHTTGWITKAKEETKAFKDELENLNDTQKQTKVDELATKIKSVSAEIEKLRKSTRRAGGTLGVAGMQDQIRLQELQKELFKLKEMQEAATTSTNSLTKSLVALAPPTAQAALGVAAFASLFDPVREGFSKLSDSVQDAIKDFRELTTAEKEVALTNVAEQIDTVKSKIEEIKSGLKFGLFGAAFTEDGAKLKALQEQLDLLLKKQAQLKAAKPVDAAEVKQKEQDDKAAEKAKREFDLFMQLERNKTDALRIANAERRDLHAIELDNKVSDSEQELDIMRMQSDQMQAEELRRIETKRALAAMQLEEDLARIQNDTQLATEQKRALEDEIREQDKERLQSFLDQENIIREQAKARELAIEEQARKAQIAMTRSSFETILGAVASGSEKARKIQKGFAIGNAIVSGYQAAVDAWKAGMSTGGPQAPFVAAAYTAASIAKTGALIGKIKSAGKSGSGKANPGGGAVAVGSAGGNAGGASGAGGNAGGGGSATSREISIKFIGSGLLNTDQVRELIGQINEQVGDGVTLSTNGG